MVSAVHLRPEPQYWFYGAKSPEEKRERVLEALRHAPRPFILYVTMREEVVEWKGILRGRAGLSRIATFDAKTPDMERLRVIEEWSENRLDGIVATSAFGVGLDKNDVRTVIHATIPETLDRYYQEVGRGGRVGKPSASLLVFEPSDWVLPERLARPKIVSDHLGFNGWKARYQSRRETGEEDLWGIDIDAVHGGLSGGSEYNVNWNMRTLILMARAGLLSLEIENNPVDPLDDPEESASSLLAAVANVRVRVLDNGHLIPDRWERAVSASRNATQNAAGRSLEMMRQLLPDNSGKGELVGREEGDTLAELYRIKSHRWPVHVSHACGGCPRDRFEDVAPSYYAADVGQEHLAFLWSFKSGDLRFDGGRYEDHFGILVGHRGFHTVHVSIARHRALLFHIAHVEHGFRGKQLELGEQCGIVVVRHYGAGALALQKPL